MLIDTHAHLAYPQLLESIDEVLERAGQAGLSGILCVGTTLEDSRQCVELAGRFEMLRAAVGLHPNNCCQAEEGDWEQIVALSQNPAVVALGETGLDRYWDDCPWEVQLNFLRRHIQLSRATGLPIVIHMRDCAEEMLSVLQGEANDGPFPGVMHSFTGTKEIARGFLDLGLYISFSGMITFKNSAELRLVASDIPLDRLLVETDSPYLTPHPFRGQRPNRPDLVAHTVASLAELFGLTVEQVSHQTTQNALALFTRWGASFQPV